MNPVSFQPVGPVSSFAIDLGRATVRQNTLTTTENHLQPENSISEEKEILSANMNENIIPDLEVGEPAAEVITVRDSEADAIKDDVKEEVFDIPTKELEVEVNKSMKNYLKLIQF